MDIDHFIDKISDTVRLSNLIMPDKADHHFEYWAKVVPLVLNQGMWLEFGVFRGRSLQRISSLTNNIVYGFDSFEGLPESWDENNPAGCYGSGGVAPAGAIVGDNHSMFDSSPTKSIEPWNSNVRLVVGRFESTLPKFLESHDDKAAFIHIDSDLYSSCRTVLGQLSSRIVPGTIICFDELLDYPKYRSGEIKAFAEFLSETGLWFEPLIYHGVGAQYTQSCVRIIV